MGNPSCIRIIELQYLITIIFPFWRMFGYVQSYNHVSYYFPKQLFGKLSFGGWTIAGIVAYLNLLFDWVTIHYLIVICMLLLIPCLPHG